MELALDLGIDLGYCIRMDSGKYHSGCMTLKNKNEDRYVALIKLEKFLEKLNKKERITQIYIEVVNFSTTTYATQAHGSYKGEVNKWALKRMIPVEELPVRTVKKRLTGKGNASKHGMIHYAEKWIGKEIYNHNEADAIGVMFAGRDGVK